MPRQLSKTAANLLFPTLIGFFILLSPLLVYADQIDQYLESGNYNQAILHLNQQIEFYPHNARNYRRLGSIYLRGLNNVSEATRYLDRAISINPKLAEAYIEKGIVFDRMNRHKEAIELYKEPNLL